jgi:hypothetical protein
MLLFIIFFDLLLLILYYSIILHIHLKLYHTFYFQCNISLIFTVEIKTIVKFQV